MANADKWVEASPRQAHEEANLHASGGLSRLVCPSACWRTVCEPAIFHLRHASLLPFFFVSFSGDSTFSPCVYGTAVWYLQHRPSQSGDCGWDRLQDRECACRDERVDGLKRKRRRRSRCRWNGTWFGRFGSLQD